MEPNHLGLVGSCQIAAHVHRDGCIVWASMPRCDAPPVFGSLLDARGGGSCLGGGEPFARTERRHCVLSWGVPVDPLAPLCDRFLQQTVRHWQHCVKQCDIPPTCQDEVIRSALSLQLNCCEDTGAFVASLATSIPEAPGLSEDLDTANGVTWGNIPQAHSHVGLIHAGFAVAPPWSRLA